MGAQWRQLSSGFLSSGFRRLDTERTLFREILVGNSNRNSLYSRQNIGTDLASRVCLRIWIGEILGLTLAQVCEYCNMLSVCRHPAVSQADISFTCISGSTLTPSHYDPQPGKVLSVASLITYRPRTVWWGVCPTWSWLAAAMGVQRSAGWTRASCSLALCTQQLELRRWHVPFTRKHTHSCILVDTQTKCEHIVYTSCTEDVAHADMSLCVSFQMVTPVCVITMNKFLVVFQLKPLCQSGAAAFSMCIYCEHLKFISLNL